MVYYVSVSVAKIDGSRQKAWQKTSLVLLLIFFIIIIDHEFEQYSRRPSLMTPNVIRIGKMLISYVKLDHALYSINYSILYCGNKHSWAQTM